MKAKIEIRIWSDDGEQPDTCDLGEMFRPHAEHVATMLDEGYTSGEICDENFRGWWEIISEAA